MHDDLKFLEDEDQWPYWPICPVRKNKEGGGFPDCGIVYAGSPIVFMLCMFDLTPEKIKNCEKYKYSSMAELVSNGWKVD